MGGHPACACLAASPAGWLLNRKTCIRCFFRVQYGTASPRLHRRHRPKRKPPSASARRRIPIRWESGGGRSTPSGILVSCWAFCQNNVVSEIYLCVDGMADNDSAKASFADVRAFVKKAGSMGMRVAALTGDYGWIEPDSTGFERYVEKFKSLIKQLLRMTKNSTHASGCGAASASGFQDRR